MPGGARPGAGRPKGSKNKTPSKAAALREQLAEQFAADAPLLFAELRRIALEAPKDSDRLRAIETLMDRVLGKTEQVIAVTTPEDQPTIAELLVYLGK